MIRLAQVSDLSGSRTLKLTRRSNFSYQGRFAARCYRVQRLAITFSNLIPGIGLSRHPIKGVLKNGFRALAA